MANKLGKLLSVNSDDAWRIEQVLRSPFGINKLRKKFQFSTGNYLLTIKNPSTLGWIIKLSFEEQTERDRIYDKVLALIGQQPEDEERDHRPSFEDAFDDLFDVVKGGFDSFFDTVAGPENTESEFESLFGF